jgi:ribosome-associated translation inhibitor RaiA
MRAKISGQVMEIREEFDRDTKNKLATVTAMIYQKGEKNLVAVKKVPAEVVEENFTVEDLPVRASTYNFDGNSGMSVIYIE